MNNESFGLAHLELIKMELEKWRIPTLEIQVGSNLYKEVCIIVHTTHPTHPIGQINIFGLPINLIVSMPENNIRVLSSPENGTFFEFVFVPGKGLKLLLKWPFLALSNTPHKPSKDVPAWVACRCENPTCKNPQHLNQIPIYFGESFPRCANCGVPMTYQHNAHKPLCAEDFED